MPNLLSAKELQRQLNISKTALYDKVSRGAIPYLRIGSTIRFDPVRIAAWLRQCEIGADDKMELVRAA